MDTLALLCTLHADGPASLKRLREAELNTIDEVLGCSVETTAEVLGLSMAQARRFHREARMLAMRMNTEGLDREERMHPSSSSSGGTTQPMPDAATAQPEPTSAEAEGLRKKPVIAAILAPVMERWDQEEAAAERAAACAASSPTRRRRRRARGSSTRTARWRWRPSARRATRTATRTTPMASTRAPAAAAAMATWVCTGWLLSRNGNLRTRQTGDMKLHPFLYR